MDTFERPHRRHVRELNVVPIIDMLTTVIFFLLLSTSFLEFTKITVPPSKVSTITNPVAPPPLAPKLLLARHDNALRLVLTWSGAQAGEIAENYTPPPEGAASKEGARKLLEIAKQAVQSFSAKHPSEKSLQIGIGRDVPYQALISLMDGARESMPDIVLISYTEAEARVRGTAPEAGQ